MTCDYSNKTIYSITFYENRDVSFLYDTEDIITGIYHIGDEITIPYENRPIFEDNQEIGGNFKLMHNYNLSWLEFGLNEGLAQLQALSNAYGWLFSIQFVDLTQRFCKSPVFLQNDSQLDASQTHTWSIEIKSNVNTFEDLIIYQSVPLQGVGYWQIESTFIVS